MYRIVNINNPYVFWSNEYGWVGEDYAESFPDQSLHLPVNGEWQQIKNSIESKFVTTVEVIDPDSGLPVEIEIRKMENGPMVGFDGSFLHQLDDDEQPFSPYDHNEGKVVMVHVSNEEE